MIISRCFDNRVVILLDKAENKTESGIHLPDSYGDKFHKGEVVKVGRGIINGGTVTPLDVQVGERVYIAKNAGVRFEDGDNEYTILTDAEILGTI